MYLAKLKEKLYVKELPMGLTQGLNDNFSLSFAWNIHIEPSIKVKFKRNLYSTPNVSEK